MCSKGWWAAGPRAGHTGVEARWFPSMPASWIRLLYALWTVSVVWPCMTKSYWHWYSIAYKGVSTAICALHGHFNIVDGLSPYAEAAMTPEDLQAIYFMNKDNVIVLNSRIIVPSILTAVKYLSRNLSCNQCKPGLEICISSLLEAFLAKSMGQHRADHQHNTLPMLDEEAAPVSLTASVQKAARICSKVVGVRLTYLLQFLITTFLGIMSWKQKMPGLQSTDFSLTVHRGDEVDCKKWMAGYASMKMLVVGSREENVTI